jgi:DNA topoisomerase-3
MQRLFIAEKPSAARAIAEVLAEGNGKVQKFPTHVVVGQDALTWCAGHLFELVEAHNYDEKYKRWRLEDLPIVPNIWQRRPKSDKRRQVNAIADLLKDLAKAGGTVVNAGDAGREGQLIVDEVLEELRWHGNTLRLWVTSQKSEDMKKALRALRPNSERHGLFMAAMARERADWLYGINLTRAYTVAARDAGGGMVLTVGRVQTPTLALVVDRYRQIKDFIPLDHYLPIFVADHANGTFVVEYIISETMDGLDAEGRLIEHRHAQAVVQRLSGQSGHVTAYEAKDKSEPPPLPYSLSALITAAKGFTAAQILAAAQKLYERPQEALTYPRTSCRYLPESMHQDAPQVLAALARAYPEYQGVVAGADVSLRSMAWNDTKVNASDHHALALTGSFSTLGSLSPVEKRVFDLVARSYIAQFYPPHRYKAISVEIRVGQDRFKATGKTIIDAGWQSLSAIAKKEDLGFVPQLRQGDPIAVRDAKVDARQTKPPRPFTDQTLVAAMSHIDRYVAQPEVRKRLRENDGLGTEATRPSIIEGLLQVRQGGSLMRREKTTLLPTDQGLALIDALPSEVRDPGMTALWEAALEDIALNRVEAENFLRTLEKMIATRVDAARTGRLNIPGIKPREKLPGEGEPCPICGKGQMRGRQVRKKGANEGSWYLGCTAYPDCSHAIFPDRVKGDPLPGDGAPCPKCQDGTLKTRVAKKGKYAGSSFLACSVRACDYIENTAAASKEPAARSQADEKSIGSASIRLAKMRNRRE